jgi:hypothetical protein
VVLTATPSGGSTFSGWSGAGCTGTGTCTVAMTAAASVTATFALNTYTLTVGAGRHRQRHGQLVAGRHLVRRRLHRDSSATAPW